MSGKELNPDEEKTLREGKCPLCGSERFWKGPRGGLAMNIMCENGHKFWVAGPFTPEYLGQEKVTVDAEGRPAITIEGAGFGPDKIIFFGSPCLAKRIMIRVKRCLARIFVCSIIGHPIYSRKISRDGLGCHSIELRDGPKGVLELYLSQYCLRCGKKMRQGLLKDAWLGPGEGGEGE